MKLSDSKYHNNLNALFRQVSKSFLFSQIENVLRAILNYFIIYYLRLKISVIIDQFNKMLS